MILKLKERYGENCVVDCVPTYPNDYYWFKDDAHHFIGILKKYVSLGEKELLATLLNEVDSVNFDQQFKLFWLEILLHGKSEWLDKVISSQKSIRFIFFTHHFDHESKTDFVQLMKAFNQTSVVLYLNNQYGVILDFSFSEEYSFEEVAQAMQQDFYQTVNFYTTQGYAIDDVLSEHFLKQYDLYQQYRVKSALVMDEHDLTLQVLVQSVKAYEGYTAVKQKIEALDSDLIEVARSYMDANLNTSMAAKAIYMHRNTFMNKLERFILTTGLNIKEFKYAVLAYVLILDLDT